MIAVIARLSIKEGQEAEFEGVMGELAAKVRANEPGCKLYQLCKTNTPCSYVVIERYDNGDALGAHAKTEHFRAGSAKLGALLQAPPVIEVFTEIE